MKKMLLSFVLVLVIFVSGCITAQHVTVNDLQSQPWKYVNKSVIVEGKAKVSTALCTQIMCTEEQPCCNTCAAQLLLSKGDDEIILYGNYSGERVGCEGSECSITCHPLTAGKNYNITGIWRKGLIYYLEPVSFEEI